MALAAPTDTAFVVRDASGRVVLAFWGDPELSAREASLWADRPGYAVTPAAPGELDRGTAR